MRGLAVSTALGWSTAALLGVLAGLGIFTFGYARGASYLEDDPVACINCHVMNDQHDSWAKSSHHAVATCNDCHVPHDFVGKWKTKCVHGIRHSKAFTLNDFEWPIRAKPDSVAVVRENCVRCHETAASLIALGGRSDAHAEASDCLHCHRGVAHGAR